MITHILNLLSKLIEFRSVTPEGQEALEFIANLLEHEGFTCILKTFGPKGEVANLYAHISGNFPTSAPNICFAGHIDVVHPLNEESWKYDPFEMTIDGDKVYGRGIVDMKGAIACALTAAQDFLRRHKNFKGSISFLLTADEEGDRTYGTKEMLKYIDLLGHKIDFCILGEPTTRKKIGDTIKIGRRGSINFDLKIQGKQGHVAYPERAINPISILIPILNELDNTVLDYGSDFFQKSNLEITSVQCSNFGPNPVNNIIPDRAEAKFNIRFNDLHTPESLNDKINAIISKYSDIFDCKYSCGSSSFIQPVSDGMGYFAHIVEQETSIMPEFNTGGGVSDAVFIHKYAEVVEFGLNCDTAHKINENGKICDLQTLYNVYYSTLIKFLLDLG